MRGPWSSQLAADINRDRILYLVAFVELRAKLRLTPASAFPGGAGERRRTLEETDHDAVALASAGAAALQLQAELEGADRPATMREVDTATIIVEQLRELTVALADRLPSREP